HDRRRGADLLTATIPIVAADRRGDAAVRRGSADRRRDVAHDDASRLDPLAAARAASRDDRGGTAGRSDRLLDAGPGGPGRDCAHHVPGGSVPAMERRTNQPQRPAHHSILPGMPGLADRPGVGIDDVAWMDAPASGAADGLRVLASRRIPDPGAGRLERAWRAVSTLAFGGPDRRLAAPAGGAAAPDRMRDPGLAGGIPGA